MKNKVRMSDIAEKIGVSTVTVSKALAGKEGVSDSVRVKILETAQKMGYQGKQTAVSAKEQHSRMGETVGILISERFLHKNESFYWNMYERVLGKLSNMNMFGMVEPVTHAAEDACVPPRLVQSGRIRAVIIIGKLKSGYISMLREQNIPIVQMDSYHSQNALDCVISDGYYGTYFLTEYLIQRGHRKIAYLGSVGATSSITDRYFGYCRALQAENIPLQQKWVLPDRDEIGSFQFQLPDEMPTAFVCNCDAVAYRLIQELNAKNYRVPEDISVVCFDDYLFSEISIPRITAYGVDVDAMAQICVKQLMWRWENPDAPPSFRVVTGYVAEKDSVRSITV